MNSSTDNLGTHRSGETLSFLGTDGVLHHLGYVVRSISEAAGEFTSSMALTWDEQIIHDPIQQVRVSFFHPLDIRNPVYELVEPSGSGSPVNKFLSKGGGLHHTCYKVNDLEQTLCKVRARSWVVISTPKPAVAFGGSRVAWVCSRNRLLVEFLEANPRGSR